MTAMDEEISAAAVGTEEPSAAAAAVQELPTPPAAAAEEPSAAEEAIEELPAPAVASEEAPTAAAVAEEPFTAAAPAAELPTSFDGASASAAAEGRDAAGSALAPLVAALRLDATLAPLSAVGSTGGSPPAPSAGAGPSAAANVPQLHTDMPALMIVHEEAEGDAGDAAAGGGGTLTGPSAGRLRTAQDDADEDMLLSDRLMGEMNAAVLASAAASQQLPGASADLLLSPAHLAAPAVPELGRRVAGGNPLDVRFLPPLSRGFCYVAAPLPLSRLPPSAAVILTQSSPCG